jgi:hypothetical protein
MTQGEGQVFHSRMSSSTSEKLDTPRAPQEPKKPLIQVRSTRPSQGDDIVQVFTPKRKSGGGGVSWGNSVVN